jgi:hypothetical protein
MWEYQFSVVSVPNFLRIEQCKCVPDVRYDPIYQMVLQSVREEFIPLRLGGVLEYPDFHKDKSPGLPWTQHGYRTKGEVLAEPDA